jgi:hypothetical protein
VREDANELDAAVPAAGDRAPDAGGLTRRGIGFRPRLFDVLRGTEHVLVAHVAGAEGVADLAAWAREARARLGPDVRVVAVTSEDGIPDQPGIAVPRDRDGAFAHAYGSRGASFLVRPDGYIGWRGLSWRDAGLLSHLDRIFCSPGSKSSSRGGQHGLDGRTSADGGPARSAGRWRRDVRSDLRAAYGRAPFTPPRLRAFNMSDDFDAMRRHHDPVAKKRAAPVSW